MATHDVVGESIDSGWKSVVGCISARGYSMVGQHLGWMEFRRETPLSPVIVECPAPLLGEPSLAEISRGLDRARELTRAITIAIK
jgi:hypothetical protein